MLQIFFQWLLATKIKTFGSAATVIRHILRRNKLTRTNKVNPLHTKGVVFISYKNENVNKDACHAHYLQ